MSIIDLTYQFFADTFSGLSSVLSRVIPSRRMGKTNRFFIARRHLMSKIADDLRGESRQVYWFHAPSLGEYQIARPLMEALRRDGDKAIVLTFFSPTGTDALQGKPADTTLADYIFPLPLDTRSNASRFIEAIKPKVAVFMVAELWLNYLSELNRRDIPVMLVSCLIRDDSRYFRLHGRFQRRMLSRFNMIVAHDRTTMKNLGRLGLGDKAVMVGDPLYDNALSIRSTEYSDDIISRFCGEASRIVVAGSLHYDKDLTLAATLIDRHPEVKFIVVPHEINDDGMHRLLSAIGGDALLYSRAKAENIDPAKAHVLIIDFVGALSRIYRYATAAYVGGGFTRFLHSVIEPMIYGLPVCFGPRIERKSTPIHMIERGIGTIVTTPAEIDRWWCKTASRQEALDAIKKAADQYSEENRGGAADLVKIIKSLAK